MYFLKKKKLIDESTKIISEKQNENFRKYQIQANDLDDPSEISANFMSERQAQQNNLQVNVNSAVRNQSKFNRKSLISFMKIDRIND